MSNRDLARIEHMIESCEAIFSFIKGKRRSQLDSNKLLIAGITRHLEILGEAANAISKKTQEHLPNIPWRKIINSRNFLIHAYFDINHDIIWATIKESLPPVHQELKNYLASLQK